MTESPQLCKASYNQALKDVLTLIADMPSYQKLEDGIIPETHLRDNNGELTGVVLPERTWPRRRPTTVSDIMDAVRDLTDLDAPEFSFYSYPARASTWVGECFTRDVAFCPKERNDRFFEEATELVQALRYTESEAHQMVRYVYSRSVGDPRQEVGGAVHTLAALCHAHGFDMLQCAEDELARVEPLKDKIRSKQQAKIVYRPIGKDDFDPDVVMTISDLKSWGFELQKDDPKYKTIQIAIAGVSSAAENGILPRME